MTAVLAITSALLAGGADFIGGFLSRTASPVRVAALAQATGLVFAIPVAFAVEASSVTTADVAWSAGSGVAVGCGLVVFYTAMRHGMISLVAPVAAVTGALVPLVYALASGERPGAVAITGIVLAVAAIGLVSLAPSAPSDTSPGALGAVPLALAAGLLFGLFIVCFARTNEDAGMWPVAISRLASTTIAVSLALVITRGVAVARGVVPRIAPIGALEVGAGAALLLALQRGPVSVASVLASLYPVTTTFLAALVLHERLRGLQLAGVALALVAVALISSA